MQQAGVLSLETKDQPDPPSGPSRLLFFGTPAERSNSSISNHLQRICSRLPVYLASAKSTCFIGTQPFISHEMEHFTAREPFQSLLRKPSFKALIYLIETHRPPRTFNSSNDKETPHACRSIVRRSFPTTHHRFTGQYYPALCSQLAVKGM